MEFLTRVLTRGQFALLPIQVDSTSIMACQLLTLLAYDLAVVRIAFYVEDGEMRAEPLTQRKGTRDQKVVVNGVCRERFDLTIVGE